MNAAKAQAELAHSIEAPISISIWLRLSAALRNP
jgi:hypothetical protein